MKNLKITLLYKIIVILLVITLGITFYRVKNYHVENCKLDEVTGIVKNIKKTQEKTEIELEHSDILITYYSDIQIKLGDKVKVVGNVNLPSKNTIPNLFNYKNYLLSRKINYIMIADKITKIENKEKLKYKIKNCIISHISKYKTKDYLNTFILGHNTIDENVKTSINNNGISHLFAVSGMHLSLFSGVLFWIFRKMKLSDNVSYIIIIMFFLFFSFLTNYSPSVLRSLFMFIGLSINKMFSLKIKTIYICIVSLVILLLYNPFYIYNMGFIFSYVVSISLILFSKNDCSYFKGLLMTSIISFLVSIPILYQNFYQVNLFTPIINLIFVPFISFIVFPLSILTFIIKPLDNIFYIFICLLERLSVLLSCIHINIMLPKTNMFIVIIYYIVISISMNGVIKGKYKGFLILILLMVIHCNINYFKSNYLITMLDVLQGDSTFIKLPYNKANVLIDTGGKYQSNIVKNKTIPYLKSLGVRKINYLILTHGEYDHMGEAINLVNSFKVDNVIFNNDVFNELETELIKVLERKKIKYYKGLKELNIGDDKLYFLNTKDYGNENDNSNVIYFKLNDYKFLFMGDAGINREKDILDKYNLMDIDFLKIGHHGSNTSSSKDFIDSIKPKNCLISVGKNNRYGHPKESVLGILDDYCDIYRTDLNGSVEIKINNNEYKIKTYSP